MQQRGVSDKAARRCKHWTAAACLNEQLLLRCNPAPAEGAPASAPDSARDQLARLSAPMERREPPGGAGREDGRSDMLRGGVLWCAC